MGLVMLPQFGFGDAAQRGSGALHDLSPFVPAESPALGADGKKWGHCCEAMAGSAFLGHCCPACLVSQRLLPHACLSPKGGAWPHQSDAPLSQHLPGYSATGRGRLGQEVI